MLLCWCLIVEARGANESLDDERDCDTNNSKISSKSHCSSSQPLPEPRATTWCPPPQSFSVPASPAPCMMPRAPLRTLSVSEDAPVPDEQPSTPLKRPMSTSRFAANEASVAPHPSDLPLPPRMRSNAAAVPPSRDSRSPVTPTQSSPPLSVEEMTRQLKLALKIPLTPS